MKHRGFSNRPLSDIASIHRIKFKFGILAVARSSEEAPINP
jgi:hypothetical protein